MERNARRYDAADYRNLHGSVIVQEIAGTEIGVRRFDGVDDASAFFARELDYIKAQAYDKLFPELSSHGRR